MQLTPSAPSPDSPIIRTGSDGRLRYSPEQRQTLLDAYDRGGQSALAFSKHHGVCYQTFIAWLRKRRESGAPLPPGASAFAEVMLEQTPSSSSSSPSALRVLLPCGTVIEVASRAALPLAAELLSTLRRPC
jgi:transposase-like protein